MDKKEEIISSAIKLFSKYWPKKTSIDEIIKEAQVGKGTFYLYFKNKEDLYKKIIDNEFIDAEIKMKELCKFFPDIKKRFLNYLIWSIEYFKSNDIIRNMVLWNENYYFWKINIKYLEELHNKILEILLKDSFEDNNKIINSDKIKFLSKMIWNFKQILLIENKCFS